MEGLKTSIIEGDVVGGNCVNKGCVPSKALLDVSGRMQELQDEDHMKPLGLQVIYRHRIYIIVFFFEAHDRRESPYGIFFNYNKKEDAKLQQGVQEVPRTSWGRV
jgi:hypothetical protein